MEGSFQNPLTHNNKKDKVMFPLDFKIVIITGGGDEEDLEMEHLFQLRSYCEDEKIQCKVRGFDSDKEDDATLIQKIPAIFIQGRRNEVMEVLYPDEKMLDKVKIHTFRCKTTYEEKQLKQQQWNSKFASLTKLFWSQKKSVVRKQ
jgi:hypothetical protein